MDFEHHERAEYFREIWESVRIERPVEYSLFTFGESLLPYFLICGAVQAGATVSITRGDVKITRPTIITPSNAQPEFLNLFDSPEAEGMLEFLLARTAAFSHLKFDNRSGPARIVSDSVEEAVERLNRQLDAEDEDTVAILSAPPNLASIAVLRYAAERIWSSAPGNVQELRERGFLP